MAFELHQPQDVAAAVRLAAALGPASRYLAGGTDLLVQIRRRRAAPRHLIALGGIGALAGIAAGENEIVIGAMTTHKEIERHPAFAGALAVLPEAARVVGGHQIRNVGTIGGNIVNASPAADLLPVLLALDAELELVGGSGARRVALARFLRGPGTTARAPEEVLLRIAFARPPRDIASAFLKAGRRRAMEISIVCVAAFLAVAADGTCREARIALGAVGPTALRAGAAEANLVGRRPDRAALREAGQLAAAHCAPIGDVRASAEYRRLLVAALVPRALECCLERIGR